MSEEITLRQSIAAFKGRERDLKNSYISDDLDKIVSATSKLFGKEKQGISDTSMIAKGVLAVSDYYKEKIMYASRSSIPDINRLCGAAIEKIIKDGLGSIVK